IGISIVYTYLRKLKSFNKEIKKDILTTIQERFEKLLPEKLNLPKEKYEPWLADLVFHSNAEELLADTLRAITMERLLIQFDNRLLLNLIRTYRQANLRSDDII